jgi:ribosomal protein S18 acetylase RimI-like enzyme
VEGVMIRAANRQDIPAIHHLDIKGYDYPMEIEFFRGKFSEDNDTPCKVYLSILQNKPIGYIMLEDTEILRLCVHPKFQRKGIGTSLLRHSEQILRSIGFKSLKVVVPECHCNKYNPDDVSVFLNVNGYLADKILWNLYSMYGQTWDGYRFEKHF